MATPSTPPLSTDAVPTQLEILEGLAADSHLTRDRALLAIQRLPAGNTAEIRASLPSRLVPDGAWAPTCSALQAAAAVLTLPSIASPDALAFARTLLPLTLPLITHKEARVRSAVADLCGKIAAVLGPDVWDQISPELLLSIERNFDLDDQQRLKEAERVAQSDMQDATEKASLKERGLQMVHETEGWRGLETSLLAIGELFVGCGPQLLNRRTSDHAQNIDPHVDRVLQYMLRARKHPNRFVREAALRLLSSIFDACVEGNVIPTLKNIAWRQRFVVSEGLQDNWSQVRSVSSICARRIMNGLPLNDRREFYPLLLPRMCLNRHYVAEGVRSYSQTTWKDVIGADGRVYLVKYIDEVVTFYESQCHADNHAVREAACQSLAEACTRLDPDAIRPYVPRIVHALVESFKDESWPVRDHACTALGNVTAHYAKQVEDTGRLDEVYDLFLAHLADNIVSVRENTARSIVKAALAFPRDHPVLGLERLAEADALLIPRIASQPEKRFGDQTPGSNRPDRDTGYGSASKLARDNDVDLHTGQVMYSCGSLAPKLRRGGGCMDHGFSRAKEPWEETDGGIRLWEQIALSGSEGGSIAKKLFPLVVKAATVAVEREFAHSTNAQEGIWRCIAGAAQCLPRDAWSVEDTGKVVELTAKSMRSENARVTAAARAAVAGMHRAVGYGAVCGAVRSPTIA